MRAYVTGGLGFIGSRVIARLASNGVEVVCVDRRAKLDSMMKSGLPICRRIMRAVSQCADVVEPEQLLSVVIPKIDHVLIHLGAVVDTSKADDSIFRENIDYFRTILPSFKKIIFASSGAVYGNEGYPDVVYGMTKAVGENMLRNLRSTAESISLRFMNVYGEDEHHKGSMASMPFKMARAYEMKQTLELFSIDDRRDFVHVDDVASAVIAASAHLLEGSMMHSKSSEAHQVYDVGTGTSTSFIELNSFIKLPDERSAVKLVGMPTQLKGRYQRFTCAGKMGHHNSALNVFDQDWYEGSKPISTELGTKNLRGSIQS